jgi:2-polyprenyl-6-methoxyphenol hydroxylase-like FAD-dependent oxidoreductase
LAPWLEDRVGEVTDWDQVKLLSVSVERLKRWSAPGILAIGDAAHTMSPVGGVGINLAIQDAVAAANRLARPLRDGEVSDADLQAVQRRRLFPTRATQAMQVIVQRRIIDRVLGRDLPTRVPWPMRLLGGAPVLQAIPARMVGLGVRPEHIRTPEAP